MSSVSTLRWAVPVPLMLMSFPMTVSPPVLLLRTLKTA